MTMVRNGSGSSYVAVAVAAALSPGPSPSTARGQGRGRSRSNSGGLRSVTSENWSTRTAGCSRFRTYRITSPRASRVSNWGRTARSSASTWRDRNSALDKLARHLDLLRPDIPAPIITGDVNVTEVYLEQFDDGGTPAVAEDARAEGREAVGERGAGGGSNNGMSVNCRSHRRNADYPLTDQILSPFSCKM